ncbi:MAG: His/Gly/Thr/Pro-type tRNA ligase C-terminal domain-containing protein, partial [Bacteroidota bacterium]
EEQLKQITAAIDPLVQDLRSRTITVKYDDRDTHKPGWKFNEYEFKGVPVRIAIGPRDLENGTAEVARRDTKEKSVMQLSDLAVKVEHLLEQIQLNIYQKALDFRDRSMVPVDSWDEFKQKIEVGGFLLAHWDGTPETEQKIKDETKATIRCIPLNAKQESGSCVYSGKPSTMRVIFARAY